MHCASVIVLGGMHNVRVSSLGGVNITMFCITVASLSLAVSILVKHF
jgi:hypothetical protein